MRDLIPPPRVSFDLTAGEYASLALAKHDASCRECGGDNSDSRCTIGAQYEASARATNGDIPSFPSL